MKIYFIFSLLISLDVGLVGKYHLFLRRDEKNNDIYLLYLLALPSVANKFVSLQSISIPAVTPTKLKLVRLISTNGR